jgi:hypothetical protein
LPVILCEYKTWSIILKEKHRVRLFEKKVLRKILGPKKNEVTGIWKTE